MQSSKWLFVGCYKPASQNEDSLISNLSKTINAFSTKCENIVLMGDFNLTTKNKHLEELLNLFNLRSLISSPVCFQSTSPCIYLILTNQEDLSSNSNTCEAGISDHHHLVSVMLNKKISKGITKALFYRDYKKFEQNKFAKDLTHQLQNTKNPSYNKF